MTAQTTYTLDNLMQFYQIAARQINPRRYGALRLAYLVGGAAVFSLGCYYAVQVLGRGDGDLVAILLAAIALYLGAQLLWMGFRYFHYYAKQAMKKIPKAARCNYYRFEDEQLVISNRLRSGGYPYGQFGGVYETEHRFFFYINTYNGYILEKSGLETMSAEELRDFLNTKLEHPVTSLELP